MALVPGLLFAVLMRGPAPVRIAVRGLDEATSALDPEPVAGVLKLGRVSDVLAGWSVILAW